MSKPAQMHSIRRTSPKGNGQKFIGTCVLCGEEGLSISDMMSKPCPNQRRQTQEEALIDAITEGGEDD